MKSKIEQRITDALLPIEELDEYKNRKLELMS
jgi:hypothetical protein